MYELTFPKERTLPISTDLLAQNGTTAKLTPASVEPLGRGERATFRGHGVTLELTAQLLDGGAYRLDYRVEYEPSALDDVAAIVLLDADVSSAGFQRVFANRRDIWLPTGLRNADRTQLSDGPPADWDADDLAALFTPGGDALLAGVVHPARYGLEIHATDGQLQVRLPLEGGWSARGQVAADSVIVQWSAPLLETLEDYGRRNRITASRENRRKVAVAWNSWDYFTSEITQQHMMDALDTIRAHPVMRHAIDAVVLDDGWAKWGDWTTPQDTFPDLGGLADAIAEAGYIPGIWYSPLRVESDSRWVAEHPDTLLDGAPRHYGRTPDVETDPRVPLDPTHPAVIDKVFGELRWLRGLGFRYYKTDFLQAPNTNYRDAAFADPHCTPVEAVRRVMQAIRAAIGYESFWLACGTEIAPLAGLPDASRVSDDINQHFATVQVAVRNCAAHFWANGNLWLNDPDFLIVRCDETWANEPYSMKEKLGKETREATPYRRCVLSTGPIWSIEEARTWANFQMVYGGTIACSDHPDLLNERGYAMVETVLEHHAPGGAGLPLDLEENALPRRWLRPATDGWLLGLFNWADESATIALSERDLRRIGNVRQARDVWSGETLEWGRGQFAVEIPAHHSRVFRLKR
jgi:hypothetical protein